VSAVAGASGKPGGTDIEPGTAGIAPGGLAALLEESPIISVFVAVF